MKPLALVLAAVSVLVLHVQAQDRPFQLVYEPNAESLNRHPIPSWFQDAKLGIFVNWGLYSVPAYAPVLGSLPDVVARLGWPGYFANNPYAEWYLNSLRVPGSRTRAWHDEQFGSDFDYADFVPLFNEGVQAFNPDAWATLFSRAHARYLIFDTKHHDGFLLWPSEHPNPHRSGWQVSRDVTGELANAVRKRGIAFGVYYSGGLDWTFTDQPITDLGDLADAVPSGSDYARYADAHWRELIRRYRPVVLWNDMGYPAEGDVLALFAEYYNQIPQGLVNNRWDQGGGIVSPLSMRQPHLDFVTPEYSEANDLWDHQWEATRGLGYSFAFNRTETAADLLSVDALVDIFVDVVSKGGNLLIGVGPRGDGTIPEEQVERLAALGAWLDVNGDAVFSTRPWRVAEGRTNEDGRVRFTHRGDALYVFLLDRPSGNRVILRDLYPNPETLIELVGHDSALDWTQRPNGVEVALPVLQDSPAHVLRVSPPPR